MDIQARIRENILAGDRYWHAVVLTLASIVAITLVFSTWRIMETSRWLQDHRAYIRDRDARWEPFMEQIEAHLSRQDADYRVIRDHLERRDALLKSRAKEPR